MPVWRLNTSRFGNWRSKLSCLALLFCVPLGFAETLTPTDVVQQTMRLHFSTEVHSEKVYQRLIQQNTLKKNYAGPKGVFVTLSRNGQPRACWGSAYPQSRTVLEGIVYATLGALTKEYRYRPIAESEWPQLKRQVTVIKALEPIERLSQVNPLRDGLLVRQGGKAGVMLPGEAKDATYQLVQCKLKAGIRPREKFQMYRMVADVYQ